MQRRESANELLLEMCTSLCASVCVYVWSYVCLCACVCVSMRAPVPEAAGEDVLPSDPQLHRALSLPVFHIIDSCSDIDRRCGGRKGKIGV